MMKDDVLVLKEQEGGRQTVVDPFEYDSVQPELLHRGVASTREYGKLGGRYR